MGKLGNDEALLARKKEICGTTVISLLGCTADSPVSDAIASNTDFHTEPTNELKTGDPVGFSAVDCKQRTEPHFPVWPARFCLLPEADTLLFKKWTNL